MGVNLYIGVPIGALCCFTFIWFSFLNVPKTKQVEGFKYILKACILWTAGSVLMRARFTVNLDLWFNISLLGLFLIPIFMYQFLFCILKIKRDKLLITAAVVTCIIVLLNLKWGVVLSPPEMIQNADGGVAYTYHVTPAIYIFALAELALLIYVTVIAHIAIKNDISQRIKLVPLLIGTLFVFAGNLLELIPGNLFPYDTLGGVLMAICLVYIMYKHYLFDISNRIAIGCIYSVAVIVVLLPFGNLSSNMGKYVENLPAGMEYKILTIALILTVWTMEILYFASKMAEHITQRKRAGQMEAIKTFQNETASVFEEEEMYARVVNVCEKLLDTVEVFIFAQNYKGTKYDLVQSSEGAEPLTEAEQKSVLQILQSSCLEEHVEIVPLKYDNHIFGCIYLRLPAKVKMNYLVIDDFRQIATYTALCMKNIGIYQKAYQNSIHDELTGLYNRIYYKELREKWDTKKPLSMIYLDMDDFKLFNELYGEMIADEILCWCARILKEEVGRTGRVFRFGSNEFLICTEETDREILLQLAQKLQERIAATDDNKPKVLQPITYSIGIAIDMDASTGVDELLKQVEKATFFAKKNGKNCVKFYDSGAENAAEAGVQKSYEQIAPTIYALTAAIDAKDSYTFEHSCNVSEYAVTLANEIGLEKNEVEIVKEAGLLHDIGKIGIPESILKKQGRLTAKEYDIMKTHVENSIKMIHFLPNMSYVIPAVVAHHERYDGNGYPRGIHGEEIPKMGRILAICDSFDAMTTKRSYKEAMPIEYAIEELEKNSGTQFDPILTKAFLKLIREGKIIA